MYNGIGLQTPRGSGTNGYIQTNKFFVRPKGGKPSSEARGFEGDQGTAGISKKPNKEILEHDRKRQIHLKLVVLEDKLIEQGYTDAEIAEKLDEARKVLEAASISDTAGGLSGDVKQSDTQTHQIAARKERQMEVLRGALGIKMADPEIEMGELVEDGPRKGAGGRPEHAFLDRDYSRKKQEAIMDEKKDSKSAKDKKKGKGGDADELKHGGSRKHQDESSESDGGAKRGRRGRDARRKVKEESEDESDSDSDEGKKTRSRRKLKKSKSDSGSDSDISASDDGSSDSYKKKRVSGRTIQRRHDTDSSADSSSTDNDSDARRKEKRRVKHKRHSSRKDESDSDSDNSNSSGSDSDHKKAVKKSKGSRRRHDSDDDSSSNSEPTHKAHGAKKSMAAKGRHDSDSDSDDADPKLQGKSKKTQLSGSHISTMDENPKKSRIHDSDDEDLDGGLVRPTSKDMGRHVERSKESHRGGRGNPHSSLLEGRRSAHGDDRRRDMHELMDRYQPAKDDEVDLDYDRPMTVNKKKLDDDEQPEIKHSRRSHRDDESRGGDREYQNKDDKRDHYARSERPTRRDNEEQPQRKLSQQSFEDDESRDARRVDYSRSARSSRHVDEISKYEGRVTKDKNIERESRQTDLSDAERYRSDKIKAWDEKDKKVKDSKREEVDDESKNKKMRVRDEEDPKSKTDRKDEVDGRSRRLSRVEEDQPLNSWQRGRDEEEGRRGRGRERSSKDEEDQPHNSRHHGREEEERRDRGLERFSRDEEDQPRNSRQRGKYEQESRRGRETEPREENQPRTSRQRGRDEEEERHDRDEQLDHFKRPRYNKRNDDRARY